MVLYQLNILSSVTDFLILFSDILWHSVALTFM